MQMQSCARAGELVAGFPDYIVDTTMPKGRNSEAKSGDLAGAPENEIEITPAMIRAGVAKLVWLDTNLDSAEMIVERVVVASLEASGLAVRSRR